MKSRMPLLPPDDTPHPNSEMLYVSRSTLYERLLKKRQHRSARYCKEDEPRLLPLIRQICSERATNVYRRVTTHLNRVLKEHNWRVNPKRIYQIMQANNMLLAKSGHKKLKRCHTDKVVKLSRIRAGVPMASKTAAGIEKSCGGLALTVVISKSSVARRQQAE